VVLAAVIFISAYSLEHTLPAPLELVLLPGVMLNVVLAGGNVHGAERDSTVFLNIALWSLVLGTGAIFCFRAQP
jgi:hypothetical protein